MTEATVVSIVFCVVLSIVFWYQAHFYKDLSSEIRHIGASQFWTEKYLHKIVKTLSLEQQQEIMPVAEDETPDANEDGLSF